MAGELIFRGAEADVHRGSFLGVACVVKRRLPKAYRHPELDARIRRERTRNEALITAEAHAAGVPTPRVLDVDVPASTLLLEAIEGATLRDALRGPGNHLAQCRAFGAIVGRLHGAGLVHGDLTTSNVLVTSEGPALIDFGLAQRSREVEDCGVDLSLVERTFAATHPDRPEFHAAFIEGYQSSFPDADAALQRARDVRGRGRYA